VMVVGFAIYQGRDVFARSRTAWTSCRVGGYGCSWTSRGPWATHRAPTKS
jgi:hypothetical protein